MEQELSALETKLDTNLEFIKAQLSEIKASQDKHLDLTRFGGYLMSSKKGAPLCHQHVPLIRPN